MTKEITLVKETATITYSNINRDDMKLSIRRMLTEFHGEDKFNKLIINLDNQYMKQIVKLVSTIVSKLGFDRKVLTVTQNEDNITLVSERKEEYVIHSFVKYVELIQSGKAYPVHLSDTFNGLTYSLVYKLSKGRVITDNSLYPMLIDIIRLGAYPEKLVYSIMVALVRSYDKYSNVNVTEGRSGGIVDLHIIVHDEILCIIKLDSAYMSRNLDSFSKMELVLNKRSI